MNILQYNIIKEITNVTPALIITSKDIKFVSPEKNVLGVCKNLQLDEFTEDVTLLNTNEFLSILSIMGIDSKISIDFPNINIKNKNNITKYITDNAEYIKDDIKLIDKFLDTVSTDYLLEFNLPIQELNKIVKLHSIMNLSSLSIQQKLSEVVINAYSDDSTASSYTVSIPLPENSDANYDGIFSVDIESFTKLYNAQDVEYNIKILDGLVKIEVQCISNVEDRIAELEEQLEINEKADINKLKAGIAFYSKFKNTSIDYYIAGEIR